MFLYLLQHNAFMFLCGETTYGESTDGETPYVVKPPMLKSPVVKAPVVKPPRILWLSHLRSEIAYLFL